jgi:EmrB/QacA subfamily drug resistance transporter
MTSRGLSRSRQLLVLATCCLSLFIVGLDVTVVNVALPSIEHDLHASVSGLQWVIASYSLVIASLMILAGATADRVGRRRTFQVGLGLFTLGSLLCSLAPSLAALIAFRMIQAVGGSMLNPVAMSIIANTFTERTERARAIGIWGGTFGLSIALGPVVGGLLVSSVGWRSIFWINIPVGLAAIVLAAVFVPESKVRRPRRFDPVGQVLVFITLATLVYGIIEGPVRGWTAPAIIASFSATLVAGIAFGCYESRREQPLLDVRFFRSVPFAGAAIIAVSAFAGFGGFLLLSTIYLQDVRGMSALHAGLYMLPLAAMQVIWSPLSGRIVGARGPRLPLICAGLAITVSAITLTGLTVSTATSSLVTSFLVFGLGFGLIGAPITFTAVAGMPTAQAGVASAVTSTSRQVGSALGVALIGSAVVSALNGPVETGFVSASHIGWWLIAGCGLAVLALGVITTGPWARRTAALVAADFGHGEQDSELDIETAA